MDIIGQGIDRVDGPAKVTGRADYAADRSLPRMAHAVGIMSQTGRAVVEDIDARPALAAPGVLAVLHHGNAPRMFRVADDMKAGTKAGEDRPVFADANIHYFGQFVAVVVAETFEQASAAARRVQVRWRDNREGLAVTFEQGLRLNGEHKKKGEPDDSRGDADAAWAAAAVKIDRTYRTPTEVHVPMEIHASVAAWDGERLHAHETTQWVVGQRKTLARMLGLPVDHVTVTSPYVGGGFGGKLFTWPHSLAAAAAARAVGRPVKLVLERASSFATVGQRPATEQRVRLGATPEGKLQLVQHDSLNATSMIGEFEENCTATSRSLYACDNVETSTRIVALNIGTPTSMRAPGAASGMFALESAMDELAEALRLDPIELRRRNFAASDESAHRAWSSNRLLDCYAIVEEKFGWKRRQRDPQSMRDGEEFLGWGFAAAAWESNRTKADVRVELRRDGRARVSSASQDIGTGTYTVCAQVAAEVLSLPVEKIEVVLGRSDLPPGPISGGSQVTASIVPAVAEACRDALAARARHPDAEVAEGEAKSQGGAERDQYTFRSFGAHAVEVRFDPVLARLRVTRVVTAIDAGRIINPKTAVNQIEGSVVMGLGMALLEESVYDPRSGRIVTDNLSDYRVPVAADCPAIDVTFVDQPDHFSGDFGVKGVGEIGITGVAAAIANAVYHATGRRVRELPIRIEHLI
ncbi:MAG TPA: xanthine dehydrogenase family protein molybdopterin-binding subunit [Opitutaceae bacterium]|jgi:xanthine dehydrogenase YagR molybdenum-binding subunit|nr:xanthine dehydrogenase family protein molybdopterin-binding subunit [Opitutaceae bacterium]